jgi:hypothetical protein
MTRMDDATNPPDPAATVPGPPPAPPPPAAVAPPAAPPITTVAGQQVAAVTRRAWGGLDPTTRRATLIVAAIIAGLFFGSQILNEAIPANAGSDVAGQPVAIGQIASIVPLSGWIASPGDDGSVRLEKGYVALDLFPSAFSGAPGALANAYVEEVLRPAATQLTVSEPQVAIGEAGSAARLTYSGIFVGANGTIEGEVTVFVAAGGAVVGDAWAPQNQLAPLVGEVHDMLGTLEVQP